MSEGQAVTEIKTSAVLRMNRIPSIDLSILGDILADIQPLRIQCRPLLSNDVETPTEYYQIIIIKIIPADHRIKLKECE